METSDLRCRVLQQLANIVMDAAQEEHGLSTQHSERLLEELFYFLLTNMDVDIVRPCLHALGTHYGEAA